MPLLRFHSSAGDDLVSLADYVGRMKEEQEAIYYLMGENLASAANSPHMDYFQAHDIEVLYLVDPIDGFMVTSLREFEEKPFKNVDDAGLELPEDEEMAAPGLDLAARISTASRYAVSTCWGSVSPRCARPGGSRTAPAVWSPPRTPPRVRCSGSTACSTRNSRSPKRFWS